MGLTDIFTDIFSSLSFSELHAEAPTDEKEEEDSGEGGEGSEEKGGDGDGDGEEGSDGEDGDGGGEEEEEEEEEDDEEPVDPKPAIEEECTKSAQCAPLKHHYDECAERLTQQQENPDHKGPKEDCVEEFFHLTHCATQCAAPKLFKQLR